MANFGSNELGFNRKTYTDILESMETSARELFGEDINLSNYSPLGMFLKVISWELSLAWQGIENSYLDGSSLNATGLALDNIVFNYGRKRFEGTKARGSIKIIGGKDTQVDEGFIIGTSSGLLYRTLETVSIQEVGEVTVDIESTEIGIQYNVPKKSIVEIINPIAGVREVINDEPITAGANIETDEQLRLRHLLALREPTTGDNAAQYRVWAKEVEGVGNVKVLPTTPNEGYVTIVITDSNNQPANSELIDRVFQYMDSVRPINTGIYVESATSKPININVSVRLAEGYNIQDAQIRFTNLLLEYFSSISLSDTYVSYGQVGRLLLEVKGVVDYENLTLNGSVSNIELDNVEVPSIGDLTLEVV